MPAMPHKYTALGLGLLLINTIANSAAHTGVTSSAPIENQ